jgi:hypothetical protein
MHVSAGGTHGTLHSSNSNKEIIKAGDRILTNNRIMPTTDGYLVNPNPESNSTSGAVYAGGNHSGYVKMLQEKIVSLETELLKREQLVKISELQDTPSVETSVSPPERILSVATTEALGKLKERREKKTALGSPTPQNRD